MPIHTTYTVRNKYEKLKVKGEASFDMLISDSLGGVNHLVAGAAKLFTVGIWCHGIPEKILLILDTLIHTVLREGF